MSHPWLPADCKTHHHHQYFVIEVNTTQFRARCLVCNPIQLIGRLALAIASQAGMPANLVQL